MGSQPGRSQNALSQKAMRQLRKFALLGTASVLSVGVGLLSIAVGAVAAELSAWGYDSQTRSLNLALPAGVMPTVSVIAPNQMLVEIPNTQIGDVAGQRIDDGLVESILLEQPTPDTLWIVVDFVPGTVLASSQTVAPIEETLSAGVQSGLEANLQQWQVSPELMASLPSSSSQALSMALPAAESGEAPELSGAASALRLNSASSGTEIAQFEDFPDLPVLEPAVTSDELISVPPLDDRPLVLPLPEAPVVAPVVGAPTVTEPVTIEQPVANMPASEVSEVIEPPFIGDLDTISEIDSSEIDSSEVDTDEIDIPVVNVPAPNEIAASAESIPLPVIESDAALPELPAELPTELPAELPTELPTEPSEESVEVASSPNVADSSRVEPDNSAELAPVIPVLDIPAESANGSRAATPSRWPEPIPFGQPLP